MDCLPPTPRSLRSDERGRCIIEEEEEESRCLLDALRARVKIVSRLEFGARTIKTSLADRLSISSRIRFLLSDGDGPLIAAFC